jgi:predicted peptidase
MMRFFILISVLSLSMSVLAQSNDYPDFEKLVYKTEKGTLPYRLLKPLNYDKNKKYPLVVFFHGAGERGTDNQIPLTHIAGLFLNESHRKNFPCFVVVPQCPVDVRWVEVDWGANMHTLPTNPSTPLQMTLELLGNLQSQYAIDEDRWYATGLSMGGYATWDIIARYPQKFAAAVPVCGGGDEKTALVIKNIPIWAFHGGLDKVVKTFRSQNMIKAIQQAGGTPKYTEYPNVGHDSWKPAYLEPQLLSWLFAQKR